MDEVCVAGGRGSLEKVIIGSGISVMALKLNRPKLFFLGTWRKLSYRGGERPKEGRAGGGN